MFAMKVCRMPVTTLLTKPASTLRCGSLKQAVNRYTSDSGRQSTLRRLKRATLRETAMAPAGDKAFNMGKSLVAGASIVGIGALCFYGAGMSKEISAADRAALWPEVVRERVRDTYQYFGASLAVTAASAVAIARSPAAMRLVTANGWVAMIATIAAMMGSGILCRSLPYEKGTFGSKQLAWILHTAIVGAVLAPMTFLGGPIMIRAACYTAGVVGGLSTIAVCAPSDKFLYMGGPLAMGLGVVFMASIGSAFLPPTTALGAGLASVALYGGLVLFSAFLLYDTQLVIKKAETHPNMYGSRPFDPVNASIGIYMDTINIFIRIATILAGGGSRRR